jgi:LPS-assembly lipoprotein
MYGPQAGEATPVSSDLAAVEVGLIPNRTGQLLRNELIRLLNPGAESHPSRYTLSVTLKETVNTFAIQRSGFATTANVEAIATYTLTEEATGNPLLAGTSRAISGYNLLDNDFSTYVAAGDTRTRAVDQLAFEIRNRLAAHFSKQARSPADDT